MFPHNNGMIGLAHRGFSLYDVKTHLAEYLGTHGYKTMLVGVDHVTHDPWQEQVECNAESASEIAAAAGHWLRNRSDSLPFFLSVGFLETHRDFLPLGPLEDPRYIQPPTGLPDVPSIRNDMAGFISSARSLDDGIGLIVQALKDSGLDGNTIIICTTDHGIPFPHMKCNLHDTGTGVLLIIRGQEGGSLRDGKVVDAMVSQIDLFPTICDLLSLEKPVWLQGKSILGLFDGSQDPAVIDSLNDAVFSEVTYHAAYEPMRGVRTARWKYIRYFDDWYWPVLPNCDTSPSLTYLLEQGWRDQPREKEMLYDLVFDPCESHNLACSTAHLVPLNEMRARLDAWMHRTKDPLLNGFIPAPKGTSINMPDQFSACDPTKVIE
jgi:arylsulfatase A-like enzyme